MANDNLQRIRFTGHRTGMTTMSVKGHGAVSQGDVIEVSSEQAERWTTPLPMRDGKEGSDWTTASSGTSKKEAAEKPVAAEDPEETPSVEAEAPAEA